MTKRTYTDSEKLAYWRSKALNGANNVITGQKNYSNNAPQYKKTGATFTRITKGIMEGLYAVNAWRKTKYGFVRATAMPISKESSKSSKGNEFIPYLVSITDMQSLQTTKYNAIMNIQTKMLVINDLGFCISPNGSGKTKTGTVVKGYFGKFSK